MVGNVVLGAERDQAEDRRAQPLWDCKALGDEPSCDRPSYASPCVLRARVGEAIRASLGGPAWQVRGDDGSRAGRAGDEQVTAERLDPVREAAQP